MISHRVIVVAGGPCAGKTKALAFLSRELTDRGWSLVMVPECATTLIEAGISPQTATRMGFQTAVFELQLAQEEVFLAAADCVTSDRVLVVCDRGLMDGGGYLTDEEFEEIMREHDMTREAAFARYGAVFHLESVARSTHGTYSHKSNASRMEDPEEARASTIASPRCGRAIRTGVTSRAARASKKKPNTCSKRFWTSLVPDNVSPDPRG